MIREKIKYNDAVKPNSREVMKLKKEFPGYFDKDGNFLIDRFTNMLSQEDVDIEREGYELQFLGKSYAKYITSTETTTVLTPDIEHNEKHENKDSENLYIVGDNLDAIKHLLNSYSGKIKCIYIDPPYNTGSDGFVYPDDFKFTKESLSNAIGVEEDEAERILNMAGKSTHSAWLTFMYPRLMLARDCLSDDGAIFISIDDNEHANLKLICDEIFGEGNFLGTLTWEKRTKSQNTTDAKHMLQSKTEYILVYKKSDLKYRFKLEIANQKNYDLSDERGNYRLYKIEEMSSIGIRGRESMIYPILGICPNKNQQWKLGKDTVEFYINRSDVILIDNWPYIKMRPTDEDNFSYKPFWSHFFDKELYGTAETGSAEVKDIFERKDIFDTVKPLNLIKKIVFHMGGVQDDDDFHVLDFFSGSATTAHAVMELNAEDNGNRKYIMVQLPEVIGKGKPAYEAGYRTIDEIGRARIEKAALKIKEETKTEIDYGYKLYRLNEPSDKTLDKIVEFDPYEVLILDDMTKSFEFGNVPGRDTILATWINMDGYGLVSQTGKIHLHQYEADIIEDSLYIIDPGLATEDVIELIKKIEDGSLNISRIVLYPYSVVFNVVHELKKNIVNLRNNRNINVIERY